MADENESVGAMLEHARQYLESACDNHKSGRLAVAFDEARHAAEVAAKALFLKATGKDFGKSHNIAGRLASAALLPASIPERKWSRFFSEHTRASYGYFESFTTQEIQAAIEAAQTFLDAAVAYPAYAFHPASGS